jgi:hypothetical protein
MIILRCPQRHIVLIYSVRSINLKLDFIAFYQTILLATIESYIIRFVLSFEQFICKMGSSISFLVASCAAAKFFQLQVKLQLEKYLFQTVRFVFLLMLMVMSCTQFNRRHISVSFPR